MQDRGWTQNRRRVLVLCASLLALALGCGDDDSSGDDGDGGAMGDRCNSPGFTETGCTCTTAQPPGVRECRTNGTWTPCSCPPPREENRCREGQPVLCDRCPGETEGRMTTCLASGTFDCSCPGGGGMNTNPDAGDTRDGG